jgi:hypothetical protein
VKKKKKKKLVIEHDLCTLLKKENLERIRNFPLLPKIINFAKKHKTKQNKTKQWSLLWTLALHALAAEAHQQDIANAGDVVHSCCKRSRGGWAGGEGWGTRAFPASQFWNRIREHLAVALETRKHHPPPLQQ